MFKQRTHPPARALASTVLAVGLILGLLALGQAVLAGNIDPTNKFAWGTNVGWINFDPTCANCDGATVFADHLEGYTYGENIGWIRLGTYTGGSPHTYANDGPATYGVNVDGAGNLSGYAWSTNTGWINFAPTGGGVSIDPATGDFIGYAWGENIGWIRFQGNSQGGPAYTVNVADSDRDGVSDDRDLCPGTAGGAVVNGDGCSAAQLSSTLTIVKEATPEDGTDFSFTATGPGFTPSYDAKWGNYGYGNGQFRSAVGVAVDGSGNVYVAEYDNNRIQKFSASGAYITQWGSLGSGDGQFQSARDVAVDGNGYVYVTDFLNHRIQKFDGSGAFVAKWGSLGTGNGQFDNPTGVAVDGSGYVYVTDFNNNRVQKFDVSGAFVTQWGSLGSGNGEFDGPTGVAVDGSGYVYVVDYNNHRIQKFDGSGAFVAEWGSNGSGDGQLMNPQNVAVDGSGYVYVTDFNNNRVQKFDVSGAFITKWGSNGSGDGQLKLPTGVAVDGSGYVYVADFGNNRIQKFVPATAFILDDETTQPNDGVAHSITFSDLFPGDYKFSEQLPAGWQLNGATCTGGADSGSLSGTTLDVALGAGENVICTFTNARESSLIFTADEPGVVVNGTVRLTARAARGVTINFSSTATLNLNSDVTDKAGEAHVTLTAGATASVIKVNATIDGTSVTDSAYVYVGAATDNSTQATVGAGAHTTGGLNLYDVSITSTGRRTPAGRGPLRRQSLSAKQPGGDAHGRVR